MLNQKVQELLNKKLNEEFYRSNTFLEMSGWAADLSLSGVQGYFLHLSRKSLDNAYSLLQYVNECGAYLEIGEVNPGIRDFDTLEDALVYVKELEDGYKADLNDILDTCLGEKDFATYANIEPQISTQHQEEFFLQTVLDKLAIMGNKGQGLYLIDKDLASAYPIPADPLV